VSRNAKTGLLRGRSIGSESKGIRIIMTNRISWHGAIVIAAMMLASLAGRAVAQEVPIVTGEHWTRSSDELKKVYLVGVANVIQIETAYEGTAPPADTQSLVPRLAKGLKGQTLDKVRLTLDRWYAEHPDRLSRPVLETLWFEIAVPGLARNK